MSVARNIDWRIVPREHGLTVSARFAFNGERITLSWRAQEWTPAMDRAARAAALDWPRVHYCPSDMTPPMIDREPMQ